MLQNIRGTDPCLCVSLKHFNHKVHQALVFCQVVWILALDDCVEVLQEILLSVQKLSWLLPVLTFENPSVR